MTQNYPPPIYSTEPGSWAHSTVLKRFPKTAQKVIDENQFPPEIVENLTQLQDEIKNGSIRNLIDDGGSDLADWKLYINPYRGKNWLEVPWFFAEHYFYRRIMEAVAYFSTGSDPYIFQKEQGLIRSDCDIRNYAELLTEQIASKGKLDQNLRDGLYHSLWGNQADLSLWPADGAVNPKHATQKILKDHLLADHSKQIIQTLVQAPDSIDQVDLMLDNAGFELVSDLGLVDILLRSNLTKKVILHLKAHPTFVSDVIKKDLQLTINYLKSSSSSAVSSLGKRLEEYLEGNQIIAKADFFWNSPLAMWELPAALKAGLKYSTLLISKGDANYRRLLGDRQWDFTLPFHQVIDFLPVPLAALRTLKAELTVGMDLDQIQHIYNQDPDWLVDGKWGVVQFAPAKENRKV
jgi:uncharacterized protein with ATP-grasp and redox domains